MVGFEPTLPCSQGRYADQTALHPDVNREFPFRLTAGPLLPLEHLPVLMIIMWNKKMAKLTGLEPVTSGLTNRRSDLLSYSSALESAAENLCSVEPMPSIPGLSAADIVSPNIRTAAPRNDCACRSQRHFPAYAWQDVFPRLLRIVYVLRYGF